MLYDLTLNRVVLGQGGLDLAEAAALIAIQFNLNLEEGLISLRNKGLIGDSYFEAKPTGKFFITEKGTTVLKQYIHSEGSAPKVKVSQYRLNNLAIKMQEIYPSGKKPGTNYYWRSNVGDVKKKLDSFFKNYGDKYTDEQILEATKNYVNAYSSDTKYMKLLNYFIWKEMGHYEGGTVNRNSELACRLENPNDNQQNFDENWTSTLI